MKALTLCAIILVAIGLAPLAHADETPDTSAVAAMSKDLPGGGYYVFRSSPTDRPAFCSGQERWVLLVQGEDYKDGCYVQEPEMQDVVIRWPDGTYSFLTSDQLIHNAAEKR